MRPAKGALDLAVMVGGDGRRRLGPLDDADGQTIGAGRRRVEGGGVGDADDLDGALTSGGRDGRGDDGAVAEARAGYDAGCSVSWSQQEEDGPLPLSMRATAGVAVARLTTP